MEVIFMDSCGVIKRAPKAIFEVLPRLEENITFYGENFYRVKGIINNYHVNQILFKLIDFYKKLVFSFYTSCQFCPYGTIFFMFW